MNIVDSVENKIKHILSHCAALRNSGCYTWKYVTQKEYLSKCSKDRGQEE